MKISAQMSLVSLSLGAEIVAVSHFKLWSHVALLLVSVNTGLVFSTPLKRFSDICLLLQIITLYHHAAISQLQLEVLLNFFFLHLCSHHTLIHSAYKIYLCIE